MPLYPSRLVALRRKSQHKLQHELLVELMSTLTGPNRLFLLVHSHLYYNKIRSYRCCAFIIRQPRKNGEADLRRPFLVPRIHLHCELLEMYRPTRGKRVSSQYN